MKKTKTSYKVYPAWEFDREVRDLEEQSRGGWQLTKGGCFHSRFHFDDSVTYRYALDFNQNIGDPVRYRETFAEQGWEFINSTYNGWHYFRKEYDPSLPEEEYQIYTDTASRQEMAGRWRKLAYGLGGAEVLIGLANLFSSFSRPAIHSMCLALASLLVGAVLIIGAKRIGFPSRRRALASAKVLIAVVALLIAAIVFAALRAGSLVTHTEYAVPEDGEPWQICFDVKLPDFYTLKLNVDAPASATVRLVNVKEENLDEADARERTSAESAIHTAQGQMISERACLFLAPGTYSVITQYDPGAEPGMTGQFEYELR